MFRLFFGFFLRWISIFKPKLSIVEPARFSGKELAAIEIAPDLVRRTLMIMKIDHEKDQDEILEKIEKLVKMEEISTEREKEKESQKQKKTQKPEDVWA